MYKINFKKLDHIQICIPKGKEDDARKFYTNILGLNEIQKPADLIPNGGLWYEAADIQLHIGTENWTSRSKRHPAFEIENLNDTRKYLEEKGVSVQDEMKIPGVNRYSFFDPFGNRIEFLEKIPGKT
ncbi:MAG TPA: VOC family protein [Ignavibacteria bacterium]|nr:VOC family protein [Ignavibacteria bacterium]